MDHTYSKINNVCLIILTAIGLTMALIYTRVVLVPFVIAIFVYAVTLPLIQFFETKFKLSLILSVLLTLVLFLLISSGIVFMIVSSIQGFLESASLYQQKILDFFSWGTNRLGEMGMDLSGFSVREKLEKLPLFHLAQNLTGQITGILGNTVLVIVFVMFFIAGAGSGSTKKNKLMEEIQSKISRYVATKFMTSLITGTIVWLILTFVGVDLAFMFGVLTFLLNFIPSVGSIIATLLPLPIIMLQFGIGWQFWTVLIFAGAIQFAIGNVIEPKVMGENLDLHPVAVLMFLIFWGLVWGLPGMFLAVPITATLRIVLSRIKTTKPLAELLAGRIG